MLSRAGAAIFQLVEEEQCAYPCKTLQILDDESAADIVAADPECIMDPFTLDFKRRHRTVDQMRSVTALAELACIALVSETSSVLIETGHSRERRRARGRVQTDAAGLHTMRAWRTLGMERRRADASWHEAAQLPRKGSSHDSASQQTECVPRI